MLAAQSSVLFLGSLEPDMDEQEDDGGAGPGPSSEAQNQGASGNRVRPRETWEYGPEDVPADPKAAKKFKAM